MRAGRWQLAIAAVALIAITIVGVGAVMRAPAAPQVKALSVDGPALLGQTLPSRLDCHHLPRDPCEAATRAALTLVAPDQIPVTSAEAWQSLLCNSTFDCSPRYLTPDATPLGSVILTFSTGPAAWVNVVTRPEPGAGEAAVPAPVAWVVRWR